MRAHGCTGFVVIAVVTVAALDPGGPAAADHRVTCAKSSGNGTIAVCTRPIASLRFKGHGLAVLHHDRRIAFDARRGDDHAIADNTAAIRLDPKHAEFLNNRGLGYHRRGDYDRAIADYDQAIRLDPKYARAFNNRGIAYKAKGDDHRAIVDYSEAIRLDPRYARAFDNRGDAYRAKGDYDRAIVDYGEAIRLDARNAVYYNDRGNAYAAKGDHDHAIADYIDAIKINPKADYAYFGRGIENLHAGSIPRALADLNRASELGPEDAYNALWLDIVNKRSNLASGLPQVVSRLDMTKWPAPVIRLFLGQLTPDAVLAAADDPDAQKNNARVCEANFYSGELALQQGAKDEAVRLFRLAAQDCRKGSIEWTGANAELKALD